jgi:hypothetical protein
MKKKDQFITVSLVEQAKVNGAWNVLDNVENPEVPHDLSEEGS